MLRFSASLSAKCMKMKTQYHGRIWTVVNNRLALSNIRNVTVKSGQSEENVWEGRGTFFGYECSSFIDSDVEKILIERSMRNGCKSIVSKSGDASSSLYELLLDNTDDDFDNAGLKSLMLGHVFKSTPLGAADGDMDDAESRKCRQYSVWMDELKTIQSTLARRKMSATFYCVPVMEYSKELCRYIVHCTDVMNKTPTSTKPADVKIASFSTFAANPPLSLGKDQDKDQVIYDAFVDPQVGLDFDTKFFAEKSIEEIEQILKSLDFPLKNDTSSTYTNANPVQIITVSANSLTMKHAKIVAQWAKKRGMTVVVTETLRTHPTRPGQLSSSYEYQIPHIISSSVGIVEDHVVKEGKDPVVLPKGNYEALRVRNAAILNATEDFKMAMDRCLQAEKVFLKKFASASKPLNLEVTSLCLAHVLANTHSSFAYPEEWNYVVHNTIQPKFDSAAVEITSKGEKEEREWLIVYRPMIKYIIASFRNLLQCRVAHLSQEVVEAFADGANGGSNSGSMNDPTNVAMEMACFMSRELECDYVLSSITLVDSSKWNQERIDRGRRESIPIAAILDDNYGNDSDTSVGGQTDVDEMIERVNILLDSYNK